MMTKSQAILRARRQKLGGGYGYVNVSHWKWWTVISTSLHWKYFMQNNFYVEFLFKQPVYQSLLYI